MSIIDASTPPRRARRRIAVFLISCALSLTVSLAYVYTQPAEYRSLARLQIMPAEVVRSANPNPMHSAGPDRPPNVDVGPNSFLTEVQVLTSRPLLNDAVGRLRGEPTGSNLEPDPVGTIQSMLHATPIDGTQIVELSAEGRQKELLAPVINAVVNAYRQHVIDAFKGADANAEADVSNEVETVGKQVEQKKNALDAYRAQYDIVSMENRENDVLAQVDTLNKAYVEAKDRVAKAQARLQAVRSSIASGNAQSGAKDDPTLASLEQRASVLRETLTELRRRFTPDYIAIDPDAKSLQSRLDDLESQLSARRVAGQRAALSQAEEELATSQTAVSQLQQDLSDHQKQAQEFATHLAEYKSRSKDLDNLEAMQRDAMDRLSKLQASEKERAPRVDVLETAVTPTQPWRPDYGKNAAIGVVGSVALGLFAVWIADFLAGPETAPPLVMQHSLMQPRPVQDIRGIPAALAAPEIAQLPAPSSFPRELSDSEIVAFANATLETRLAVVALLMGLSPEELVRLRWNQIDLDANVLQLSDGRRLALREPLRGLVNKYKEARPARDEDSAVLSIKNGLPLTVEELERLIFYGAYDAGLQRPEEVSPNTLRYTFLSYLLRQGVRSADIATLAGDVPHEQLVALMQNAAPLKRLAIEEINVVLPALGEFGNCETG